MSKVNLDDLIGIPFVNGGRERSGSDCWGIVMLGFSKYGIDVPDFLISCFDSLAINENVENQRRYWKRLDVPEEPCLVVLKVSSKLPMLCTHNGVYVGNGMFLHTFKKRNSVLESINHIFWKNRIEGFYQYVG